MTELQFNCPICGRALGKNESLTVMHDSVGSLIVWHNIPQDIRLLSNEDTEVLWERVRSHPINGLHYSTPVRNVCGLARFTKVEIT